MLRPSPFKNVASSFNSFEDNDLDRVGPVKTLGNRSPKGSTASDSTQQRVSNIRHHPSSLHLFLENDHGLIQSYQELQAKLELEIQRNVELLRCVQEVRVIVLDIRLPSSSKHIDRRRHCFQRRVLQLLTYDETPILVRQISSSQWTESDRLFTT